LGETAREVPEAQTCQNDKPGRQGQTSQLRRALEHYLLLQAAKNDEQEMRKIKGKALRHALSSAEVVEPFFTTYARTFIATSDHTGHSMTTNSQQPAGAP
jgi:hypothetical protein